MNEKETFSLEAGLITAPHDQILKNIQLSSLVVAKVTETETETEPVNIIMCSFVNVSLQYLYLRHIDYQQLM